MYTMFAATVTEKLGRHKLLLKKRKAQSGRSSAEYVSSQEDDSREIQTQSSESFANSNGGTATNGGSTEAQPRPIRIRQSFLGGRAPEAIRPIGPSDGRFGDSLSESGPSGGKRLERLPARGPGGVNPGRGSGGLNRFADLLKNRREGERREEGGKEAGDSQEKKTDVTKVYQTYRRPQPGIELYYLLTIFYILIKTTGFDFNINKGCPSNIKIR
jgi:hypothetical protein